MCKALSKVLHNFLHYLSFQQEVHIYSRYISQMNLHCDGHHGPFCPSFWNVTIKLICVFWANSMGHFNVTQMKQHRIHPSWSLCSCFPSRMMSYSGGWCHLGTGFFFWHLREPLVKRVIGMDNRHADYTAWGLD